MKFHAYTVKPGKSNLSFRLIRLTMQNGKAIEMECVVEEILPVVIARLVELVRSEK